jgi:hypothetical protein
MLGRLVSFHFIIFNAKKIHVRICDMCDMNDDENQNALPVFIRSGKTKNIFQIRL